MPAADDPLALIRSALAGRRAWLVGGAVRDRLLGRPTEDYDVVLDGAPGAAARALARAAGRSAHGRAGAAAFALSEEYGGWRVVARDGTWQVDLERLRGASLEEDLALRDFTVNALAEPLGETGDPLSAGGVLDPLGGVEDLARRRLRAAAPEAFAQDPLRVLRLARLAVELDLEPDAATRAWARAHAPDLRGVAGERVFAEVSRVLAAPRAAAGLELMETLGATAAVLPEVHATVGVRQGRCHHRDVYGHTLEVLERTVALQADPAAVVGDERGAAVAALLAEPLADGLTRSVALRWGALLAKTGIPAAGRCLPASVATGMLVETGTDRGGTRSARIPESASAEGAQLAGEVLGRLRASRRLRDHVAALVRHHLRLGFLVHEPQPLARRTVWAYLRACEPVEVDVTLLSMADRLATLGERAQSTDAHLSLARTMLDDALRWRAAGPPRPLWRGDELARELGVQPGPRVGELLEELAAARYAGEIATPAQALEHARAVLAAGGG